MGVPSLEMTADGCYIYCIGCLRLVLAGNKTHLKLFLLTVKQLENCAATDDGDDDSSWRYQYGLVDKIA